MFANPTVITDRFKMALCTSPSGKTQRTVVTRKRRDSQKTDAVTLSVRASLSPADLSTLIESFLIWGDIERHTVRSLGNPRERLGRLIWLAEKRDWSTVGESRGTDLSESISVIALWVRKEALGATVKGLG